MSIEQLKQRLLALTPWTHRLCETVPALQCKTLHSSAATELQQLITASQDHTSVSVGHPQTLFIILDNLKAECSVKLPWCVKSHLLFRKWFCGGARSVLAIGSSLPSLLGVLQSSQGGVCTAGDQLGHPSFQISYSISTWHHLARCLRASYDRDDVPRCGGDGAVDAHFV